MRKAILCVSTVAVLGAPVFGHPDMVIDWNNAALYAIRTDQTVSPMATRALAMMHVAIYDAVNAIDQAHAPFYIDADAPGDASREAAAAAAACRIMSTLYPDLTQYWEDFRYESMKHVPDSPAKDDGVVVGEYVADQILAWRAGDGWDTYVEYIPGNRPGDWRPTPPDYLPAMLPQWPQVVPWTMTGGDQFRVIAPPALESEEYAFDFNEVKELGAIDSPSRTQDQTEVAQFWADDPGTCTPAGHWNMIAQECSIAMGYGLGKNALLFAKLNVALADAAIVSWDAKYAYNLWRPYHAIVLADEDGNPLTDPDPNWMSLLEAPPVPEYTSSHSAIGAAAAQILAYEFTSDDMHFTLGSDGLPGVYRSYTSFSQAADEAGRSRIYGGVHFEFANVLGQESGRSLADYVQANFFRPINNDHMLMMYPTYFRTEYLNVFEVFHAQPGDRVKFLWSEDIGEKTLRRCPDIVINLNRPRIFRWARADDNGYAVATRRVPLGFRDQIRYGQTLVLQRCEVSNLVQGYFPR